MQLNGKLVQLLPLQSGTGKNGTWRKQDIIVETEGQYPKKVCISIWGDKIDTNVLQVGKQLNINFDIESREFNGKWYTDCKAWKVDAVGGSAPENFPDYSQDPPHLESFSEDDDLPF